MDIGDFVTPDRVIPLLLGTNKYDVLKELARLGAAATNLDPDKVLNALLERQDSTTIGLGRGIAIPHGTIEGIDAPVGFFARLQPPVDFGAVDGVAADLAVMILAPENDPRILLRALSCTARRLREGDIAACLRSASDAKVLYAMLVRKVSSDADVAEMDLRPAGT
ncbi:PTS sugar transporter subunit IIA [Microvirga sp. GCM10011540]|uniref:PTS sugar transporter subunit IIA n=1 Tax=Microvirga sp. GCM10011540 TaxID=3317338 RepID=UPI00361B429B